MHSQQHRAQLHQEDEDRKYQRLQQEQQMHQAPLQNQERRELRMEDKDPKDRRPSTANRSIEPEPEANTEPKRRDEVERARRKSQDVTARERELAYRESELASREKQVAAREAMVGERERTQSLHEKHRLEQRAAEADDLQRKRQQLQEEECKLREQRAAEADDRQRKRQHLQEEECKLMEIRRAADERELRWTESMKDSYALRQHFPKRTSPRNSKENFDMQRQLDEQRAHTHDIKRKSKLSLESDAPSLSPSRDGELKDAFIN